MNLTWSSGHSISVYLRSDCHPFQLLTTSFVHVISRNMSNEGAVMFFYNKLVGVLLTTFCNISTFCTYVMSKK